MDMYGITPYLERAKAFKDSADEHALRYAALELRFCMEMIVYRQLQQYGDVFPGSMIGVWKPDQLLKLLASFDPVASMGGELAFASLTEDGSVPNEWMPLGKSRTIPWKQFRKLYNKLGSYLHAPAPRQAGVEYKPLTRESFGEVIAVLEDVMSATLIMAVKAVISAKCSCGTSVYVGQSEFDDGELVVCTNTKCNSLYAKAVNEKGEQILDRIKVMALTCQGCQAKVPFPPERIWAPIRCPGCSRTHRLNLAFTTVQPAE
ncbi:hypothetical protein F1C79_16560 [Pseudomonas denitrificans (nom. rej.)]|uniref:Uncharacterized protein n=2 Tax=Pseudomonas denitrificans TaxID=43306 RepID=A0A9X7R7V6_PSEDE|nr:hypothetical protein F1C79_16560 [Pseudomonas denitrificans (nom. rej.)]